MMAERATPFLQDGENMPRISKSSIRRTESGFPFCSRRQLALKAYEKADKYFFRTQNNGENIFVEPVPPHCKIGHSHLAVAIKTRGTDSQFFF